MEQTKLRVLDLFAGVGGFSLGLESTHGFQTVAFCEIDHYARSVLAKHWPSVIRYGDVQTLTPAKLERDGILPIDIITAGFPCQDISLSGKGDGLEGTRSRLWSEVVRLARDIRPRYILMENVAALTVRGLGTVLGTLASLGYDTEAHCIRACYLGAWHRRDRIWILAYPRRIEREGVQARALLRQSDLSRKLSRGFAKWPGRADLPASRLCRGDDGISARMERTRVLGNSVVPQIPEMFGHVILEDVARQKALMETS